MRVLVGKVQHRVLQLVQFSDFFKFPKPPRECLQQLVKVSSQSDELRVLLYGTNKETFIFIYKLMRGLQAKDASADKVFEKIGLKVNI